MKKNNDIMVFIVFVLSVICLASSSHQTGSFSAIDHVFAWMGVVCFTCYYLRAFLAVFCEKYISVWRFLRRERQ